MIVLCAIGQSIGHAVAGLLIKWRGYVWQTLVCASAAYILALVMFRQTWQGIVDHVRLKTHTELLAGSENVANELLWPVLSGICMGAITNCLLINLIRGTSQDGEFAPQSRRSDPKMARPGGDVRWVSFVLQHCQHGCLVHLGCNGTIPYEVLSRHKLERLVSRRY